jgi:hypothetical protein
MTAAQFDERAGAQALRAAAVRQLLVKGSYELVPEDLPLGSAAEPTAGPRSSDDPNADDNGRQRG